MATLLKGTKVRMELPGGDNRVSEKFELENDMEVWIISAPKEGLRIFETFDGRMIYVDSKDDLE